MKAKLRTFDFVVRFLGLAIVFHLPIGCVPKSQPIKASWTAMATTMHRAAAATEPDEKIRNPDYLAEKFVSTGFLYRFAFTRDLNSLRTVLKRQGNRSYFYVNARTHHIDTILKSVVAAGVEQIVNLGVGYDSRAYRFKHVFPQVTFIEVDLPATIEDKKERVLQIFKSLPDRIVYAPCDFNTQTLEDVLNKAGYDKTKKTFFILEGVTYYITKEGVDSTLRVIARHSATGSSVIFDHMLKSVADGDFSKYPDAKPLFREMAAHGEPYTFGIEDGKAEAFVNQRGLKVLSDLSADEIVRHYLTRSDGTLDGQPYRFFMIMHAIVNGS